MNANQRKTLNLINLEYGRFLPHKLCCDLSIAVWLPGDEPMILFIDTDGRFI